MGKSQVAKIKCHCPRCKKVQYLEYLLISKTLKCKKCGARFVPIPPRPESEEIIQGGQKRLPIPRNNLSGSAGSYEYYGAPMLTTRFTQRRIWPKIAAVMLLAAVIVIVIGFGFIHVINGSSLSVPHVINKASFGYSETFINIDKITGMPWIFAKVKYPIGCRILQDRGHIESDEAFQRRVSSNYESKTLAKSFDQP